MKLKIKNYLGKIIEIITDLMIDYKIGRFIVDKIVTKTVNSVHIIGQNGEFKFFTPNVLNVFRVQTFYTKEPETLEWIDSINKNSVFWDIGANIGLYSIYAAKNKNCRVFSFEPSVFNLEFLARNIWINDLVDKVAIIPLPLSDKISINKLNMTTMEWGGALSTFGKEYGYDGKPMNKIFEFSVVGVSMDDLVNKFKLPYPEFIKIDVDGIEHLILKGGKNVLNKTKEILIEINDDFKEQSDVTSEILKKAGFVLKEKKRSEMFENTAYINNTYNQIWSK